MTELPRFRRLLSRQRLQQIEDAQGRRTVYEYTIELDGGGMRVCDAATLRNFSLKAASAEPEWRCTSCTTSGWSQARACICIQCGAHSPVDAALMTELKQAKRVEMATHPGGATYLKGRRVVLGPQLLQQQPRAEGAYDEVSASSHAHLPRCLTVSRALCCSPVSSLLCERAGPRGSSGGRGRRAVEQADHGVGQTSVGGLAVCGFSRRDAYTWAPGHTPTSAVDIGCREDSASYR